MVGCCRFFDHGILGGCCCFAANFFYCLRLPFKLILWEVTKTCRGLDLGPLKISRIGKMPTPHHRTNAALPFSNSVSKILDNLENFGSIESFYQPQGWSRDGYYSTSYATSYSTCSTEVVDGTERPQAWRTPAWSADRAQSPSA